MSERKPSGRRRFLRTLAVGGAGAGLLGTWRLGAETTPGNGGEGDFSFVHLTDMHVRRARRGHDGYARCVEAVNALRPRPAFVLMGGDGPFDGLYTAKEEFEDQIALFREISERLEMPVHHCIGNHDALGLSARRKVPPDDPDIGKGFIMERLGMERSHYSFNHRGWHFVVLDSIFPVEAPHGPGYVGRIGREQLEWLAGDLAAHHGMPTVAVTHIPVFSHLGQIRGDRELPSMHGHVLTDGVELRHVLERHGVQALLQGHIHKPEEFRFNGVWYLTSPAVSAAWWGGNWRGFEPGYTVYDVRDGRLGWRHANFAWVHRLEPEDTLERERNAEHRAFLERQQALLEAELAAAEKKPEGW
ncbi:MAG: hypothetical protein EA425_10190 [Puniceicoccaceae bacterium]|nr:MAG: hypothetical protein EA425_10190 [Puniceicoccaceae bacterium]